MAVEPGNEVPEPGAGSAGLTWGFRASGSVTVGSVGGLPLQGQCMCPRRAGAGLQEWRDVYSLQSWGPACLGPGAGTSEICFVSCLMTAHLSLEGNRKKWEGDKP